MSALVGCSDVVFTDLVILGLRFGAEPSGASTDPRPHLLEFSCGLIDALVPFGTNSNALFGTQVQSKVAQTKSWLWTCGPSSGLGRNMDSEIDKAKVISGLFGLITAKLEDAHEASVSGQGQRVGDETRGQAIVDIRSAQDEIAILLSAIELVGGLLPAGADCSC